MNSLPYIIHSIPPVPFLELGVLCAHVGNLAGHEHGNWQEYVYQYVYQNRTRKEARVPAGRGDAKARPNGQNCELRIANRNANRNAEYGVDHTECTDELARRAAHINYYYPEF